jgi:hypothetical protein
MDQTLFRRPYFLYGVHDRRRRPRSRPENRQALAVPSPLAGYVGQPQAKERSGIAVQSDREIADADRRSVADRSGIQSVGLGQTHYPSWHQTNSNYFAYSCMNAVYEYATLYHKVQS